MLIVRQKRAIPRAKTSPIIRDRLVETRLFICLFSRSKGAATPGEERETSAFSAVRIDAAQVYLPKAAALASPNQFPKAAEVIPLVVFKGIPQFRVKIGQGVLALQFDAPPRSSTVFQGRLEAVDLARFSHHWCKFAFCEIMFSPAWLG
jgi:hypothetical protein